MVTLRKIHYWLGNTYQCAETGTVQSTMPEHTSPKPSEWPRSVLPIPKRTYQDDMNDPMMMQYRMIMNAGIVYKRYVAKSGHEEAFQRTMKEVGEMGPLQIRANHHRLMAAPC